MSIALALAAGCAGQVDNAGDESAVVVDRFAIIQPAEHHDGSPPLTIIQPASRPSSLVEHEVRRIPRHINTAAQHDPVLQQSALVTPLAPTIGLNFDGIGQGIGGFTVNSAPPDTTGDVGPNHFVALVNSDFAVFNKSGTLIFGPVATNTLWSGFGGGCQTNNDGDGIVLYDPLADRWIISQFSVSTTPFLQCVAVSQTPDPTGAYNRYSFSYTNFPDYPKFGVWPDAYYVTFNTFNAAGTAFLGGLACAYDRTKMLAGAAATQQCFNAGTAFGGLLPADLDGPTPPPAGSPNYIVALGSAANTLAFWKFHVNFTTPASSTFTGPTTLATAAFSEACAGGTCIPQTGTTNKLDSLADRLMYRFAYRNFGDHESLVVNHSITSGSSTGIRWYELRSPGTTPTIFQSGTWAPDTNFRWMGSAAMDSAGNIAVGYSVSSSTTRPSIRFTGRLAGDAPGTMTQGESTSVAGAGSQTGTLTRWGDYSTMSVDPSDDCTFWYTDEYLKTNGTFNWSTRINSFKLPGCPATAPDFGISASPGTLTLQQGSSTTSTISTTQVGGSGTVALSATVSPADPGVTATLSSGSVSAGGSVTLTVSASASATVQSYTVTVTGTEGSVTHSTSVSVSVTAPPPADFTIAASPASLTLVQGNSGTSAISTTQVGSPGTVSLLAAVSPAGTGVTASLSAASVAAGGGTTLTVTAAAGATTGSYTVTVTGTEGAATHAASVAVTVNALPPADFTIAASPASLTVAQGASGSSTVSTTQVGSPGTVSLSVAVSPAGTGVSASLGAASVTAGGSTSVTVSATAGATTGAYTVTITGTEGASTHSASIAVTVSSVTCTTSTQLFGNPGFETGSAAPWTSTPAVIDASTSGSAPHSGTVKAWLDGYGRAHTDDLYQTVTIPAGACSASLSFWLKITTAETTTTVAFDTLTVTVRNSAGTVLSTLATYSNLNKSTSYAQKTFDVSSFKGQTVRIQFHGVEDTSLQTSFFIDDTALTVLQ